MVISLIRGRAARLTETVEIASLHLARSVSNWDKRKQRLKNRKSGKEKFGHAAQGEKRSKPAPSRTLSEVTWNQGVNLAQPCPMPWSLPSVHRCGRDGVCEFSKMAISLHLRGRGIGLPFASARNCASQKQRRQIGLTSAIIYGLSPKDLGSVQPN